MKLWQALSLAGVTLFIAGAVGFCLGRAPAFPAPAPSQEPVAQKKAEAPKAEAPVEPAASPAASPAQPGKKPVAGKAKPAGPQLPATLAKQLNLSEQQEIAVRQALQEWETRLKEINKKKQDAFAEARKTRDMNARRQMEAAASEEWRQMYTVLKSERTQKLTQALTPEQAGEYQAFRDKQYQVWLDQKTTMLLTTTKAVLGLTPQQVDQLKPTVRGNYDQVTMGGNVVPQDASRESANQALRQQIQATLTPDQLKKFETSKSTFTLR